MSAVFCIAVPNESLKASIASFEHDDVFQNVVNQASDQNLISTNSYFLKI